MNRTKEWTFTVSGSDPFPLDMLRYDGAIPNQSIDSRNIHESIATNARVGMAGPHWGKGDGDRRIRLRSFYHEPTPGRWESYGWSVSDVQRAS